MLLGTLLLGLYNFSKLGLTLTAGVGAVLVMVLNGYWFGRSFGRRTLRDEGSQIVAEKVICGLPLNRVSIPKTEVEKVGVQVIQRRGNKNEVRIKFYRLSTNRDLTLSAFLKGKERTDEFLEQVSQFVDSWSTLETQTIDATQ